MNERFSRRTFIAGVAALGFGANVPIGATTRRTLLVYDSREPISNSLLPAIREALSSDQLSAIDVSRSPNLSTADKTDAPSLIIGIGDTAATSVVAEVDRHPNARILAAGVSGIDPTWPERGVSSMPLSPNYEAYLQRLVTTFPTIKKLGVLQGTRTTMQLEQLSRAASGSGIELVNYEIFKREELSNGLDYVARRADALFALPEPTLYNQFTARHILTYSLRQRLPLIGPSEAWVRNGAVFSVRLDFSAVGAFYGTLGNRLLAGEAIPAPSALAIPADAQSYVLSPRNTSIHRLAIAADLPDDVKAATNE
ncbi:MAG: ABC transporter substrate binding protein [Pseudomonadota bacterium]